MTAHFAGQRRAGFGELGLDEGMTRLPNQRHATGGTNSNRDMATAFDVINDGLAGATAQHIARIQNQLTIGPNDFA